MIEPNFLVIGAQKAGTTWLSENISCHPEVYSPATKELHYFNKKTNFEKGKEWYLKHFEDAKDLNVKAIGEYTPNYFWTSNNKFDDSESYRTKNIPKLIKEQFPDIKLILILRNPVQRAISAYYWQIMMRRISPNQNILEIMKHYGILSMGFYDEHLNNYLKYFDLNQMLILIFENDLLNKKDTTIERIYKFIGVDKKFKPTDLDSKKNPRAGSLYMRMNYYSSTLGKAIKFLSKDILFSANMFPIKVTEHDKYTLMEIYKCHDNRLEEILGKKISWNE